MNSWILVIDDDPWTREALVAILHRAGYLVTASPGFHQELAEGGDAGGFQVAIVDFHLPTLNGLEVARRLKELQPECRILMISSEPPAVADLASQDPVVDRFLAKPFSKDAILEVIAELCPTAAA
ncbi:MAG: response regulator [Desulfobaccales bacterium]